MNRIERKKFKKIIIIALVILLVLLVSVYFLQEIWAHRKGELYQGVECVSVIGWFTKEDRLKDGTKIEFADLQPGDILITLSTHSMGWRHGHAALVIDEKTVLESGKVGEKSRLVNINCWKTYSDCTVLRIKDVTKETQKEVTKYAMKYLYDVRYSLLAGLGREKVVDPNEEGFGLQCSYLVWFAWQHFGVDLDSDGGRLVTACDILDSEEVEVVQKFPR